MSITYNLDDSIATFLSTQTDTTREECDILARSLLLSAQVSAVPIQGAFSYTVADHSRLAQFRGPNSPLDVEVIRRARSIHGPLIAETIYHGQIGRDRPLLVYLIERIPGITYIEYQLRSGLRQSLSEQQYNRQRTLIEDFARYVRPAVFNRQMLMCVKILRSVVREATGVRYGRETPVLRK